MKPFARIARQSEDYEDAAFQEEVNTAAGPRRRSTRKANLGTFTGYRIGFDIGNGNIGWCILFEDGKRLCFLTAQDIADHNSTLPKSATRTQLPDLPGFVPLGTHKFDARERQEKGDKSLSKIRAESRAKRHMLDARQRRRLHVKRALQDAGLLPKEGEDLKGQVTITADVLRVKLLDPPFPVHPHDLGRALYNALKRRGYVKPIGRAGPDEGSGFATRTEEAYRQALQQYGCRTIGEFLERCASDARRDKVQFRKRHRSLAWQRQKEHGKERAKDGDEVPSYEALKFLTPTFSLVRKECEKLRGDSGIRIDDDAWARIEEAAEFRRPLQARTPGRCRWFPGEYRCVTALPSFQRFRSLQQATNLRDRDDEALDTDTFNRAVALLSAREMVSLKELSGELGIELKLDRGDGSGARRLEGAKTDVALGEALGEAWRGLPVEQRDDWTMRFLRRHWPSADGEEVRPWNTCDDEALKHDAEAQFGPGVLERVDRAEVARKLEDRFSSLSVKAVRLLGDCYAQRLDHGEQLRKLREQGAPEPALELYERLPYYGQVMPDETVPATGFAPEERTVAEERQYGRAANPDVHVVMNRLRAVVNAIIEMMGGILPTRCAIEMARSTFSEAQAAGHTTTNRAREKLRKRIEAEIEKVLGATMPVGPGLDRLVDRWKAAVRQGWRDYDGSDIQPSALVDGSEYQLDHVEPAAFGDFRENNMFVSRFNRQKGRRLPWEAFGDLDDFQPALVAFTTFGLDSQIEESEKKLRTSPRRKRLEETLARAQQDRDRLDKFGEPRPDVLKALARQPVVPGTDAEGEDGATRKGAQPFRPRDRAALFRRFHPDRTPREGGPAARDIANIGWSTKLARRYLRHLGAETEPIKAWAVHALRCMFDINKERSDLRNHAVDAFLVAHFDSHVLGAAFARLSHACAYEELYTPRALQTALSHITGGTGLFKDFQDNLARLEQTLPTIHTAHRADNRWNPGDKMGGGLGAFGKENIYSFRPAWEKRKKLTGLLRKEGVAPDGDAVLSAKEILARYEALPMTTPKEKHRADNLAGKIELHYRNREGGRNITLKRRTALPLSGQKGAFINSEGKFAVVGAPKAGDRQVISVAEFARMNAEERASVFRKGSPIFRRGDTVLKDGQAFVVTGLNINKQLIAYPVNEAARKQEQKRRITPDNDITRLTIDVLGRRLHRRRKAPGGIQPVSYPLRGK